MREQPLKSIHQRYASLGRAEVVSPGRVHYVAALITPVLVIFHINVPHAEIGFQIPAPAEHELVSVGHTRPGRPAFIPVRLRVFAEKQRKFVP